MNHMDTAGIASKACEISNSGDPCESNDCGDEFCQSCCVHEERDHGICMQCEHDANGDPVAMSNSSNE